jgi:hypothetical protein
MVNLRKIKCFAVLLCFSGIVSYSQVPEVKIDTTRPVQQDPKAQGQEQVKQQEQTKQPEQKSGEAVTQTGTGTKVIKQVKSARPDMSKSKGARPNVVRPSGSTVPKGIGKPGGAGRIGGR